MNKTEIENDFTKRYGNGSLHTCFVPIPLNFMGSGCAFYGGSSLILALNAGVWACARINSSNNITIETTDGNVKISVPYYSTLPNSQKKSYRLIFKLIKKLGLKGGIDFLFHCDLPQSRCIDTEIAYCVAAALLIIDIDISCENDRFDIPYLIADTEDDKYMLISKILLTASIGNAVYVDSFEKVCDTAPLLPPKSKIICAYPEKKHLQNEVYQTSCFYNVPENICLNELTLDSIADRHSQIHALAKSSQNARAAFKILKSGSLDNIYSFFNTFSDKCKISECDAFFHSDTDIYFAADNNVDYIINELNRTSPHKLNFIVSECSDGAQIISNR